MITKLKDGLRMTYVILMLMTLVFVGSTLAYADDDNAPAADQEVIETPQAEAKAEKADAEATQENADAQEADAETPQADAETEEEDAEAAPADADVDLIQMQLGSSNYSVSIPRSYRNGDVTIEEVKSNQVAYYFSPDSAMDFDIYQFPRPYPEMSLEQFTERTAADFNGSNARVRTINGVEVGTYKSREVYDGIEYDVMSALIDDGEDCVEIVFWLDGENAEQEATTILNTLSQVEYFDLQLGTMPFCLSVPKGYRLGEESEAEVFSKGQTWYYYSEYSPLDFDVYQWKKNGDTLEKFAIEEAQEYEAEQVDYRTVNDVFLAYYYSYEEYDSQMYTVVNYLFEDGKNLMKVSFWLDGEIAVRQADRILSTLRRTDGSR